MRYVEVLVGDASYHKNEPLTYASNIKLSPGQIVLVALRNKPVLGLVVKEVGQPSFSTKPVLEIPELPVLPSKLMELLDWLLSYYPAPLGLTVQLFLPSRLPKKTVSIPPLAAKGQTEFPQLTDDQQSALNAIASDGLFVLHGETGSGKTRVYLELAKKAFAKGASSMILTPEIGLTPQLVDTFQQVFGARVVVVHSGLTDSSRQETWQSLLQEDGPVVVIGARSALFSPLKNIGLIVVDEAHEPAYKQDQAPYYHTTTVAAKLAELHKATLVLGSATPLIRDYYMAQAKGRPIIRMSQTAIGPANTGNVTVVDLKDRKSLTKSAYLSDVLIETIRQKLANQEQTLLFLNRRGTARVIFCQDCGWQSLCPHCDLPLVYHEDVHRMRCHSCSFMSFAPANCPQCKNTSVVFKSVGTKAIEAEVKRLFPEAKSMRFDTDNKKSERLEKHYEQIRKGEIDIVIGTQTLAKGLDLPNLGLVGVIIADTGLYFPDFSAQERTYQLISQVLGRIGRGHREGDAIIQTYSPENAILQAVLAKQWGNFYNSELLERQTFLFPPFCFLLKIVCKRSSADSAQKAAMEMASTLRSKKHNVVIEGPAPAFHEKVRDKYVWQIIIKAKQRKELVSIVQGLPKGWLYDIDPINLL